MGLSSHLFHIDLGGPSYLHTRLSFKATVRKCAAIDFLCLGPKSAVSPIKRQLLSSVSVNLPWPHWRYPPVPHPVELWAVTGQAGSDCYFLAPFFHLLQAFFLTSVPLWAFLPHLPHIPIPNSQQSLSCYASSHFQPHLPSSASCLSLWVFPQPSRK